MFCSGASAWHDSAADAIGSTSSRELLEDLVTKAQKRLAELPAAPGATRGNRCTLCGMRNLPQIYEENGKERPMYVQDGAFKGLDLLNTPAGHLVCGSKNRLVCGATLKHPTTRLVSVEDWFPGSSLLAKLANALATPPCINMKELVESVEFFSRTRCVVGRRCWNQTTYNRSLP